MVTTFKIAAGIVLALVLLTLIAMFLPSVASAGPSGGGWDSSTKTTREYWHDGMPCRSAKVTIHKWGPTISGSYDWQVWQWLTACIGGRRGHLHIRYQHHTVNAQVCQYTCDVRDMSFNSDSWGCIGCRYYGHSNTWKISRDLDLVGIHSKWYPKISMTFYVAKWAPYRGNISFSRSVSCYAC